MGRNVFVFTGSASERAREMEVTGTEKRQAAKEWLHVGFEAAWLLQFVVATIIDITTAILLLLLLLLCRFLLLLLLLLFQLRPAVYCPVILQVSDEGSVSLPALIVI